MSTATIDRVIMTCPECGADRQVARKTYNAIRRGKLSPCCHPCGNRKSRATKAPPPPPGTFGDWRVDAACRGHDPELWFPDRGRADVAAEAKQICAQCPVRKICGEKHAGERWGIYAGLTPAERGFRERA